MKLSRQESDLLKAELVALARTLQPITVRGLYYQAVISSLLEFITKDKDGDRRNYRAVQGRVLELRQTGRIAWDWIVDPSRADYGFPRWESPADFSEIAPHYFRLDLWAGQPIRPLLIVEKVGQVPVFQDHANRFGVDVVACKGYGSATHLRDVAGKIEGWLRSGQRVHTIVAADFDPSGCDWPRAAKIEIDSHLGEISRGRTTWQRELVTVEDLDRLGPAVALRAPNPNDSRTKPWLDRFGFSATDEVCVEMDAINPAEARGRLEQIYVELFAGDIEERRLLERQQREAITTALAGLQR